MTRILTALSLSMVFAVCSEQKPKAVQVSSAKAAVKGEEPAGKTIANKRKKPHKIKNAFEPQVAGQFYSNQENELRDQLSGFFKAAKSPHIDTLKDRDVVGILAPHAGYPYSGPVAGEAYKVLANRDINTVVLLALSHRRAASKVALLGAPAYDTPLGSQPIDAELSRELAARYGELFEINEGIFTGEHSLEVQIPFVQTALPKAKIVPMIIAVHDEALLSRVSDALFERLGARGDVAFVVSSDLSHYFPYDEATRYDKETLGLIEKWRIDDWKKIAQSKRGMCGYLPMLTFMKFFEKYDLKKRRVTLVDYRNSGDTTGDRSREVVGYGALAFSLEKGMRNERVKNKQYGEFQAKDRRYLMDLAKRAVAAATRGEPLNVEEPTAKILKDKGAAFVTLKINGQLRGCIGHVIARIPLYQCVSDVARAAAISDPRFNPVRPDELENIEYEVSVLTAPEPTTPDQVVVGRDGLIMSNGGRSGLLLPQVPVEWGWDREEFLRSTCRKAGLPLDCWKDPATKIESFRAIVWGEDEVEDE